MHIMKSNNIKKTEVHLRSINKESFDFVNNLRKRRRYTWNEMFNHLKYNDKRFISLLDRGMIQDNCAIKSMQTVSLLLPKWCDNIAKNMDDILVSGDISCLVCKTRKDNTCKKIEKLKQMANDPSNVYTEEEISKELSIPLEMTKKLIFNSAVYSFVNIAGSVLCYNCDNYIINEKPALIIGGGPSLEQYNHLELLKKYGFDGDIFTVSKVLKDVLDKGIVPKYVGALDADYFDTTFFDHEIVDKHADKIEALFGINIHPTTAQRWKGNKHYFIGYIGESDMPNISHVLHLMTHCSNISASGNVGSCLYNIASFLGYNPIVMIGMDLSFPTLKNMKEYYPTAKEEDWNKDYEVNGKKIKMIQRGWNPVYKKSYYLEPVYASYKESHLSWVKALYIHGLKTINCSEQGSLHSKYITNMTFEEYLKNQKTTSYPSKPLFVKENK